jgi:hypothetical protein
MKRSDWRVGRRRRLVGAMALAGILRSLLFQVSPADPLARSGTCAAVLALTPGASLVPARRLMRVDPTVAPRAEYASRSSCASTQGWLL